MAAQGAGAGMPDVSVQQVGQDPTVVEEVKRPRGRPPKSQIPGFGSFAASAAAGTVHPAAVADAVEKIEAVSGKVPTTVIEIASAAVGVAVAFLVTNLVRNGLLKL